MVKRVLLALGGAPSSRVALRYAVELARLHGASLVGVSYVDSERWKAALGSFMTASEALRLADSHPWAVAEENAKQAVERFERECADAGVACQVRRSDRRPIDLVCSEWRYCDLVVFGLRHLFDPTLAPEPDAAVAQLTRRGVRPMLAVPSEYREVRRVLVAHSGSLESSSALKQFVQLRLWPNAALSIACFGKEEDESQRLLADATAYCRAHGVEPAAEAVAASARDGLNAHVKTIGADLVVLGDSFRHLLVRDLLGATTSQLIRTAERPLFLSH